MRPPARPYRRWPLAAEGLTLAFLGRLSITLAAATFHHWTTTYSLMRLLYILSCILWLLPQVYILSLELFEAKVRLPCSSCCRRRSSGKSR